MINIAKYIIKIPKPLLILLSSLIILGIGVLDYLLGYEISFSIFYLMPIILITWFVGALPAIFMSILSALVWLLADLIGGYSYSHSTVLFLNAGLRLSFFLIFTYIVSFNKTLLEYKKEVSRTDSLTGIANWRGFCERANFEMDKSVRFKRPLTIAYIDIDNFKYVNDFFGHIAGDSLLKSIADVIKLNLRLIDTVCRVGGDEFVILLPETGYEQSKTAIEKVKLLLFNVIKKKGWPITFSIGVVTCNGQSYKVDELITIADDLMYSVKKSGKNSVKYKNLDV